MDQNGRWCFIAPASARVAAVISRSRRREERRAGLLWRRPVRNGARGAGGSFRFLSWSLINVPDYRFVPG